MSSKKPQRKTSVLQPLLEVCFAVQRVHLYQTVHFLHAHHESMDLVHRIIKNILFYYDENISIISHKPVYIAVYGFCKYGYHKYGLCYIISVYVNFCTNISYVFI